MAITDDNWIKTPGLDSLKAMQTRPFGTNNALYRDPATEEAGRAFRRERSDFNRARRLLRREMSRGGATGMAAADRLLQLNPAAEERGIAFGGVQSAAGTQQTIGGRLAGRQQEMADMELGRQAQRKALTDFMGGRTAGAEAANVTPTNPLDFPAGTTSPTPSMNVADGEMANPVTGALKKAKRWWDQNVDWNWRTPNVE